MPDRRRYFRSSLNSPVEFTGADPRNVTFGFATDLSSGGAFVQTAFPAASGSPVVVRLWRPGWPAELHLRGVVRWSRAGAGAGMGVEFAAMGRREAQLVDELAEESHPAAQAM
jgi:uncharacterized protein (TIGR02266 family)